MITSIVCRRATIAATAVLAGLVLAACGDADTTVPGSAGTPTATATAGTSAPSHTPTPTPTASPTRAIPAATGPHNDLDVMFATDMIPHHRQAVEMATFAETRATDARVKNLAARIRTAQEAEVAAMASWLKGWGQPVPAPDQAHTAHGPGMMDHSEMEDLKAAKGRAFDRMFCDMMVRHHQGALEMANVVKTRGKNRAVRALAAEVAKTQKAEVTELRGILADL
jgi:uncharacterized protein (DUF305 family)